LLESLGFPAFFFKFNDARRNIFGLGSNKGAPLAWRAPKLLS
jgi:hypothetical protein